jgi:phosphoglycerate dehydrogenase-like enzyme
MKILITIPKGKTRDSFIPDDVAARLEKLGEVVWNGSEKGLSSEKLRDLLPGVDVCITGWITPCFDGYVLENADRMKLLAHTGGSVAPYVSDAFFERGIAVISGNRMYAEAVAEGVVAYILCALRALPHYNDLVQNGRWRGEDAYNEGLLGKTIGLVGFGMVARFLVGMLKPFRNKILVYDPYVSDDVLADHGVQRAALEDVISGSRIISLHAPRTPGTYHMISRELLSRVADGALLINTARGSVVDEQALADELQKGRFKAVLDVFETEPLPAGSRLRGLQDVLLIPHMAGPTLDMRKLVTMDLIDDIENFFNGLPVKNEISREYAVSMTR